MIETQATITANAIPTTRASLLQFNVQNVDNNDHTVWINIKTLLDDGSISSTVESFTVTADGTIFQRTYRLTDGFLISATAATYDTNNPRGTLYCNIRLQSGDVNEPPYLLDLAAGYISLGAAINYPLSPFESAWSGTPGAQNRDINTPVTGADMIWTATPNAIVHLDAYSFNYETGGPAANRRVRVTYFCDGFPFSRVYSRTTQPDGDLYNYIGWRGPNMPADNGTQCYLPIPNPIYNSNFSMTITADNKAVDDQFGGGIVFYRSLVDTFS